MGIEFRDGRYRRDVSFGKRTVKDGEAVAVWNRLGVHTQIVGPRLVYLFFSSIQFLDRFMAGPDQYLIVTRKDGVVEHLRGPISLYKNPVFHQTIEVKESIDLMTTTDCLVVSRNTSKALRTTVASNVMPAAMVKDETLVKLPQQESPAGATSVPHPPASEIQRLVIRGPTVFFPQVGDKVHQFEWHGRSESKHSPDGYSMHRGALKFNVLKTNVRQWKIDAPVDIISNKVYGTLALTFSFSIEQVDKMLDNTVDLTGDMRDALATDLISLATAIESMITTGAAAGGDATMSVSSDAVNGTAMPATAVQLLKQLTSYPTLIACVQNRGVLLHSVAFRAFRLSPDLLSRRAETTTLHAKLAKESLIAENHAEKAMAELNARRVRVDLEQELTRAQLAAKRSALDAENDFNQTKQNYQIALQEQQHQNQLSQSKIRNDESLRVLMGLKNIGVDINALLVEASKPTPMLVNPPTSTASTSGANNAACWDKLASVGGGGMFSLPTTATAPGGRGVGAGAGAGTGGSERKEPSAAVGFSCASSISSQDTTHNNYQY